MIINCKDVALYPTEYTKKSKYNLSNKVFVDYSYLFFDYTFVYHYLNNTVFLSRNYRLIVAPRKFDVLKTNICPGSEASRANMLGLRTSVFQGQLSDR